MKYKFIFFILLFNFYIKDTKSLRNVSLTINPNEVNRGKECILSCRYDLEGLPLLSVKWYRGTFEFYRYTPTESPNTKTFPYDGINVDQNKSNASQVLLRNVGFALSGNLSCEVTVEEKFNTAVASKQLIVVDLPKHDPVIKTDKDKYSPNDTLIASCTSAPSKPAATLSFLLNNEPVGKPDTKIFRTYDDQTQSSILTLNMKLRNSNFNNGKLILKCTALITPTGANYRRTAEKEIVPIVEPIPERVTSMSSSTGDKDTYPAVIVIIISVTLEYYTNLLQ